MSTMDTDALVTSALTYRVGGREYPCKHIRGCHVCDSAHRLTIENGLLTGRSYTRIQASLPEGHGISLYSIKNHARGTGEPGTEHLPTDHAVLREVAERRADALGLSITTSEQSLVDGHALAEAVIQKTWERVATGAVEPSIKDGLDAAKFISTLGLNGSDIDQDSFVQAFIAMQNDIAAEVGAEAYQRIGARFNANPVLRALAARWAAQHGEVYDETMPESLPASDVGQ